jgi:hypothetical protein
MIFLQCLFCFSTKLLDLVNQSFFALQVIQFFIGNVIVDFVMHRSAGFTSKERWYLSCSMVVSMRFRDLILKSYSPLS